jgi:outer membrane protein assembly factor BamB
MGFAVAASAPRLRAEDWPEWRGRGRTGVWTETGIIETFPASGPPVKWRTKINAGYAGPSVADGRVFVTDSRRTTGNRAIERAVALDENTGAILWTREWETNYSGLQLIYAIGPRATPTVDGDRVYVVGTMGHLLALSVTDGHVLWQKDYVKDYDASIPSWGMSSSALVEGNLVICIVGGEPDAKVMAFDKMTGKEVWRALSADSEPGYGQPIMIEAAGLKQLIIYHPTAVTALDPATGKIYWEVPYEVEMGMTIPTPVRSGSNLLVTSQYDGPRLLRLNLDHVGATLVWKGNGLSDQGPSSLNSTISTPVIDGEYIYGVDYFGQLLCLELATGKQVWESMALVKERGPWGTAFFVRQNNRYFINNDRGELIIANLTPRGYEEISRTKLLEPTHPYTRRREFGGVLWSHPAYANKHVILRNDYEIVRFSLASGS